MTMETVSRCLPADLLMEEYCKVLSDESSVEALPLTISGNSMSPFLVHGRDTVYLSRITRPLRRGDVVLYRRDNGNYILHRIHSVKNGSYTMIGDAHYGLEPGIRREQILAIMTSARRKGKLQQPGCFWWDFFRNIWLALIPLRRPILILYTALKGSKHT